MFRKLANYFTKAAIDKKNPSRQKQFLNWDKIERVALIIDNGGDLNKSQLDKFVEKTKKYVDVFFVELNSKQASFSDWQCFSRKDKTFLGLPTTTVNGKIKSGKYDLVINATNKYGLFAANLTSLINAGYKCGCNNLYGELDLIIERKETQDLLSYLKEVRKYLEMIRTE